MKKLVLHSAAMVPVAFPLAIVAVSIVIVSIPVSVPIAVSIAAVPIPIALALAHGAARTAIVQGGWNQCAVARLSVTLRLRARLTESSHARFTRRTTIVRVTGLWGWGPSWLAMMVEAGARAVLIFRTVTVVIAIGIGASKFANWAERTPIRVMLRQSVSLGTSERDAARGLLAHSTEGRRSRCDVTHAVLLTVAIVVVQHAGMTTLAWWGGWWVVSAASLASQIDAGLHTLPRGLAVSLASGGKGAASATGTIIRRWGAAAPNRSGGALSTVRAHSPCTRDQDTRLPAIIA